MKLTAIIILSACLTASANGYSQKVTLSEKNASLEKVFRKIHRQTGYNFLYNDAWLQQTKKVTIQVTDASLIEVLNICFNEQPFTYSIVEQTIVVKQKPPEGLNLRSVFLAPPIDIRGRVTNENGEPVEGASITIKGTNRGTTTDSSGNFALQVPDGSAVLVISYVGFETTEIQIGNRTNISLQLKLSVAVSDQIVVIGYGTVKKKDLTGSVTSIMADNFKTQSMVQVSDMLTGTIAGFNANQGTSAAGGASLEIRGPKSLSAGTDPLIVLDGAIFYGSLRDINPNDIQTIDILKDASSSAIFGAKAASGVVIITTTRGKTGKPTINFSAKLGMTESNNQRRGLGPEEYIQFRKDFFRQIYPDRNFDYYTDPNKLPGTMTIDQWRALSNVPLADNTDEYLSRLNFFPIEVKNYKAGKTMDMYDEVFRKGLRQEYNLSITGGTDNSSYFWSIGSNNNEGIIVGDQYSSIRSRLNADFKIADWLNVGLNTQFSNRDESSMPAKLGGYGFYVNSPYGEMFDANGNLARYPHGVYDNPLLDHYRVSLMDKTNNLFTNVFANIKLPFGINYKLSFQPYFETTKYLSFTTISEKLGGVANEVPEGERHESSTMNWQVDNLLTWKKEIGVHGFDITLLANFEENQYWSTGMSNRNFLPNQRLGYHGLQFGNNPGIDNYDTRSTGDAYMARLNYTLMGRYLLTASVRRDGFSAFGSENPRATFPALALAWVVSDESFFNVEIINRLKLRLSWGVNGNRDIGIYSALAGTGSSLWYDGTNTRVGVQTSSLANSGLKWERTSSLNAGLDIMLLKNRIDLTADFYDITTTDLLMYRFLPQVTGFQTILSNLGELGNRGFEMTLNTRNISTSGFTWRSSLVFSLNRNKIKKLFGDIGTHTLLGKEQTGEVPDYSNQWFPGQALDVVWDYDITGIWQTHEAAEAAKYNLEPGDYKSVDVDGDGEYINFQDKKFIGYTAPRYRLGLRNDFTFLKNFTASIFVRADLGHLINYIGGSGSWDQNAQWNFNKGPEPYWTATKPNNEYPRLNPSVAGYGGGISIYKPGSFVRIQDVSLTYNMPSALTRLIKLNNLQFFGSIRNLTTFTKWPGWDPESGNNGMDPMPKTYTLGLNFSL